MTAVVESFTTATGVDTVSIAKPANVATGDLLILICGDDAQNPGSGSWTAYTGWTLVGNGSNLSDASVGIYTRVADGTEPATAAPPHGLGEWVAWYLRVTGHDGVDVSATDATGASTTGAAPAVTTTVADCLVIAAGMFDGGDGYPFSVSGTGWPSTVPANQELQQSTAASSSSGVWVTRTVATAGSSNACTFTASVSDGWALAQIAIAPGATVPTITDVGGDEDFRDGETVTITGAVFEATQGTGKVELSDNATYATGTKVEQTTVNSWADGSISIDADLGALAPGPLWLWVTNNTGDRNATGFVVTVHRKIAFELAPSANIAASAATATTAQLTGGSGTFTAGRISDDTNPLPNIDIGDSGYTELEWSVQPTADVGPTDTVYEWRVVANGNPLNTYTVTPTWTVGTGAIQGSGTSSSSSSSTATGTVTVYASGTSNSSSSSTGTGYQTVTGTGTSSSSSSSTGTGYQTVAGTGTSSSSSSSTGTGYQTVAGTGTSTSSSSSTATGTVTVEAVGTSTASSSSTATGTVTVYASGTSSSSSSSSATGETTGTGSGTSTASSSSTATGYQTVAGTGTSSSSSSSTGTGYQTVAGTGTSTSSSSSTATGTVTVEAVGTSTASSSSTATGTVTVEAVGTSTASSSSTAAGESPGSFPRQVNIGVLGSPVAVEHQPAGVGPFLDGNGAIYFLAEYPWNGGSRSSELTFYKSADRGLTWSMFNVGAGSDDLEAAWAIRVPGRSTELMAVWQRNTNGRAASWRFGMSDHTPADSYLQEIEFHEPGDTLIGEHLSAVAYGDDIAAFYPGPTSGRDQLYGNIYDTATDTWGGPFTVAGGTLDNETTVDVLPHIAATDGSTVHIVWTTSAGSLYHRTYNGTVSARSADLKGSTTVHTGDPFGVIAGVEHVAGVLHVVWRDTTSGTLYAANLPDGGSWSTPTQISTRVCSEDFTSGATMDGPNACTVADPTSGRVYVLFGDATTRDLYRIHTTDGASWVDETLIAAVDTMSVSAGVLEFAPNDRVIGIIVEDAEGGTPNEGQTNYHEFGLPAVTTGSGTSNSSSSSTATGTVTVHASGTSSSSSSSTATGTVTVHASGTSSSSSSSTATGYQTVEAVGTSTSSSSSTATGYQTVEAVGTSTSSSSSSATGQTTGTGSGTSTSSSSSTATGTVTVHASGTSTASSSSTATGEAGTVVQGSGTSTASSSSTATGTVTVHASGTSTASSSSTGTGHRIVRGAGTTVASSTSACTGHPVVYGTGTTVASSDSHAWADNRRLRPMTGSEPSTTRHNGREPSTVFIGREPADRFRGREPLT